MAEGGGGSVSIGSDGLDLGGMGEDALLGVVEEFAEVLVEVFDVLDVSDRQKYWLEFIELWLLSWSSPELSSLELSSSLLPPLLSSPTSLLPESLEA